MPKKIVSKTAAELLSEYRERFSGLVGQRATYHVPGERPRPVKIVEATDYFVRLEYKPFAKTRGVHLCTCVTYFSLICGEERIEVKEVISREVVPLAG